MTKRFKPVDSKGIDKLIAEIKNNPTITSEELIRKAYELGYAPMSLIDAALGSVKYDKSKASLDKPLEDILNDIYEDDPTPGKRYVIDPSEAISPKAKEIAKQLEGNVGIAQSINFGDNPRAHSDYVAIRPAYSELDKLKSITHGGHELKHNEDFLIRPNVKMTDPRPYRPGHHYKEIYEPAELIREARELPKDPKIAQEVVKQSKKMMIKPSMFTRLRSLFGPIAAGAGLYSALKSDDTLGAVLEGAALADPTGLADAAAEVNRRLKMNPEEQKKISKEDFYSAMPDILANEQRMLDSLEDEEDLTVEKKLNKRKKELGYE